MSTMLQHAKAWAARGFRVFPLRPNTKLPRDEMFYAIASNDPAEVERLWTDPATRQPGEYNIGVSTDGIVVMDVDVKDGKDGLGSFERIGGDPNTLAVNTPSGGIHFYYIAAEARSRIGLEPGLDVRSYHSYAVAPGSRYVDPKTGNVGYYTLRNDRDMNLIPEAVEQRMVPPNTTAIRQGVNVEYDDPKALEHAVNYLTHVAKPSIEGMGGDANAYDVAAWVVRDLAIRPETAARLMWQHWNERCVPPWSWEELYTKCENAATYATGTEGAKRPDAMFGEVVVLPSAADATPQQRQQERGVFYGNMPDALSLRRRPWVYKGMSLRREVTTIIAEGAGGKSTLALVIAAHAALGLDFGPYALEAPGVPLRVLVHDDENSIEEQHRIMWAICAEYRLDLARVSQNVALWAKEHGSLVLALLEGNKVIPNEPMIADLCNVAYHADLFMLNPLVNLHQCNENDNGQMKSVMNIITRVATEADAAAIVFHHSSKGSAGVGKVSAGNAEVSRGAGAIINASRIALTLTSLSAADKELLGIREDKRFTRIDDAKSNLFARNNADNAKLWMRWDEQIIPSGDRMGVPTPYDIQHAADNMDALLVMTLDNVITGANAGRMAMTPAIKAVMEQNDLFGATSVQAVRSRIDRLASIGKRALLPSGRSVQIVKTTDNGTVYLSLA